MNTKSIISHDHPSSLTAQLAVCGLAVVVLLYIPLPILPLLAQTYHLDPDQAGYVVQAFGFAYAFGFLIFGPLSDRIGRKKVMLGGLLALIAISLGLTQVTTAEWFLAGRTLQGLAAASFPPVALAYLAERGTARQRVWGMAWMSTAFLSAGLLGQIYGAAVAVPWGFGVALLPLVVVYTLTALRLGRMPEPIERAAHGTASLWSSYRGLASLLGEPKLRRVYLAALLLLMAFVAFYLSLDIHFGEVLEQQGISIFVTRAVALPAFLAPLMVAAFIPRWGAHRVASLGLGITACGLAFSAIASSAGAGHPYWLLAASVVFVAGVGISVPGLIARVASVAPPAMRGLAVSFYTFVLFVGASLGPWLARRSANVSAETFFFLLAGAIGLACLYSTVPGRAAEKSKF